MELRGLAAQLLDLLCGGVRLEQRVIDQFGHLPGAAARRMQTQPARTGGKYAADLIGTAIGRESVAGAPRRCDRSNGRELLENDLDDAANVRQEVRFYLVSSN